MPDHAAVRCARCPALVLWTITATGRPQAVDAESSTAGNLAVYRDAVGTLRSRGLTKERPAPDHLEWQAMPHAATCSNPPPKRRRPRSTQGVRPHWAQGRQR